MMENVFYFKALPDILDMSDPSMRSALLAQLESDLNRCHDLLQVDLMLADTARDLGKTCRTAHEVKGIAVTIGADALADFALRAETACHDKDAAALGAILPELVQQTCATARIIERLSKDV